MALSFPTEVNTSLFYRRGAGQVFIGPWLTGGADTTLYRCGGMTTPVEFEYKRDFKLVETENDLAPIDGFPIKETCTLKASFLDLTLKNWHDILNLVSTSLTAGGRADNTGSVKIGADKARSFLQVVWQGDPAPQSSASSSVIQIYKAIPTSVSTVKFDKKAEATLQVTFTGLHDKSAELASKGPIAYWFEA